MAGNFNQGYALLIGVDENQVEHLKLPAVSRDIDALYGVLTNPEYCGYIPENISVVKGQNATHDKITLALTWLKNKLISDATGNATAIIYFSGHGHRDAKNYYLLPFDIADGSQRALYIQAVEFAKSISEIKARRLLVLLDCCHASGISNHIESGETSAQQFEIKPEAAPIQLFFEEDGKSNTSSTNQPGGALSQDHGRAVISSSQGNEKSFVLKSDKMSVFTYHLIQALIGHAEITKLPGREATVTVYDVANYLSKKVPETVAQEQGMKVSQRPMLKNTDLGFPIALVHGGIGYEKNTSPPDAIAVVEKLKLLSTSTQNAYAGHDATQIGIINITTVSDPKLTNLDGLPAHVQIETLTAAHAQLQRMPHDIVSQRADFAGVVPFHRNAQFVGRAAEMLKLADFFKATDTATMPITLVLRGLGGVGKSQLAIEFAYRYGQYFRGGVFWISFSETNVIDHEFARCGELLSIPSYSKLDPFSKTERVRQIFANRLPRLLIFDNCEEESQLKKWLPKTGGSRILVTSRRNDWDPTLEIKSVLPVGPLDSDEGVKLLRNLNPNLGQKEESVLREICQELGGLPLALHLAGGYLAAFHDEYGPSQLLAELKHENHQSRNPAPG